MSDFKPLLNPRKALSNYLFNLLPELPEAESSILVASEPVTDMPVNTADSDEIRISLPFQALLFEVNGFSLVLPFMVLDGIENGLTLRFPKCLKESAHYLVLLSKP